MSLADEFLAAVGNQQAPTSLADEFAAAAQGATPADLPRKKLPPPEQLSMMDKLLAKIPSGLVNNPAVAGARVVTTAAAGPLMGGAQLIANALPDSTGIPQAYNSRISEVLKKDQEAKAQLSPFARGSNEMVGGMVSPASLAMALNTTIPALSIGARAIQGGGIGAVGGATAPVDVPESGKYWGQKAAQTAIGAAGGAIIAPIAGAVMDKVTQRMAAKNFNPATAARDADKMIESALRDSGQKPDDLPPDQLASLRQQVTNAMSKGQSIDAAAALRLKDFQQEGIDPLRGWITRDPMQWAEEQNVRGVAGVGEPVSSRMASGNAAIMKGVSQYGTNAQEPAQASQILAQALKGYDEKQAGNVSAAYATARASAGKDLELPGMNFAQTYMQVKQDFEGRIPPAVQKKIESFAEEPFTFGEADKLRKVINAHVGENSTTDQALGILRSALNNAQSEAAAGGGPFAPAVKMAAQRFAQMDEIPALAQAANGPVDDRFVRQAIINNPSTPQVQKLAALLKQESPEAFQQARQQIGDHLTQAAFGENAAGDKLMRQESYNKALRNLGTGKLEAFFAPEEVDQLKRLGRIGADIVSPPAASASNYSSTASALANLLRKAGKIPVAGPAMKYGGDWLVTRNAISSDLPVTPNLTPEQRLALSRALVGVTGGGSAVLAGTVGQ